MTASVYLTISLTVERYFSVVKPFFQMRNTFTKSSVCLATPGLIFSILFTLPNYFMLETQHDQDPVLEVIDSEEPFLQDIDFSGLEENNTMANVSTSQGLIQVVIRDRVPFKVVGHSLVPRIEFAKFRSNETYITVSNASIYV